MAFEQAGGLTIDFPWAARRASQPTRPRRAVAPALTASESPCERAQNVADLSGPRPETPSLAILRTLIAKERPSLLAKARRLCRNEADAQDLVQSAAMRALERADKFLSGDRGRSWLIAVLCNLFIDSCRRDTVAPRKVILDEERLAAPDLEPEPEPAYARVTAADLRRALDALDGPSRRVFELFEVEQKSYVEIAETLGIAKNTVGTRLMRTRRKLRELLLAGTGAGPVDGDGEAGSAPPSIPEGAAGAAGDAGVEK